MTRLRTRVAAVVRSTPGVAAMAAELAVTATPAPAPVEHRDAWPAERQIATMRQFLDLLGLSSACAATGRRGSVAQQ